MVTPVAVNPFEREVLVDLGGRYEKGFVTFTPVPQFRPAGYGVDINADDPASPGPPPNRARPAVPHLVALPVLRRRAKPPRARWST